jgi:hypothetical protein
MDEMGKYYVRQVSPGINFTSIFVAKIAPMFLRKKVQTLNVSSKKLGEKLMYKKPCVKCW